MVDEHAPPTDRDLVLGYQPSARVEFRESKNTNTGVEYRVVYTPSPGQKTRRGPWCRSEQRAWEAACLSFGLRLRSAPDRSVPPPGT
jgi:hypothetical protein